MSGEMTNSFLMHGHNNTFDTSWQTDIDTTQFTIRRQKIACLQKHCHKSFVRRMPLIVEQTTSNALVTATVMAPLFTSQCRAAAILREHEY